MFKKPLTNLKTSAPLRSSDRRKLKQRILHLFPNILPGSGDLLVPEGLLSEKFTTHIDEPGIVYLAPDGIPLWFALGKGSEDLIPTVYTLWKQPNLLPCLSTPAAVIPVLVGGADLMIPGVVQHPPSLSPDQLVSITQYHLGKIGPPLAVGRMALPGDELNDGKKGKAVLVLHTWKDCLWELGSGGDVPEAREISQSDKNEVGEEAEQVAGEPVPKEEVDPIPSVTTEAPNSKLSPQEVTSLLRTSLLQAISTTLSKLPPSSFPITATVFYATYILPSRPFTPPSSSSEVGSNGTSIDIKSSSHKSLTTFLKSCEKEGLLKLKDQKTTSKSTELVITAVFSKHADIVGHRPYTTLKDMENKKIKMEEREELERKKVKEMGVREIWKAWQSSVKFFEEAGGSTSTLYTRAEVKAVVNAYIASHNLVNSNDQSYINIDPLLLSTLSSKNTSEPLEFLKRDDLMRRLIEKMQPWYEINVEGNEPVVKKGTLKPISVIVKVRQGRKASTLITNFEPFLVSADVLAEELRKNCASATSVSPVAGKPTGLEVLVQGKQIAAVVELLVSKGIPKKWIETADLSGKK